MGEWERNVGTDILVFPPVLSLAYLFSFRDLPPITGEALYRSVESEFGTVGNIKVSPQAPDLSTDRCLHSCCGIVSMQQLSLGWSRLIPGELARQAAKTQR